MRTRQLLLAAMLALLAGTVFAAPPPDPPRMSLTHPNVFATPQVSSPPIQFQNQGTPLGISFIFNCSTGLSCSFVNGVMTATASGSGTIGSCATANAIALYTAATTLACDSNTTDASGAWTYAVNGAASTPAVTFSGTPFAGTGTTSTPLFYFNGGTAPTTWSTGGTYFGWNCVGGFAGNIFDLHSNGSGSTASLTCAGLLTLNSNLVASSVQIATAGSFLFGSNGSMSNPANGVTRLLNAATTGYTRLAIGPDTSSFPGLCPSGSNGALTFDQAGGCTTHAAITAGTITGDGYATGTNCSATGTAANPSVASCSSAAAGSFSCATNASTGTCVVNTTAVTANSEIFVTQRSDTTTGTRLGVTCNATLSTAITEITAVTAATSFTINLGTITTNPECFSYLIVN